MPTLESARQTASATEVLRFSDAETSRDYQTSEWLLGLNVEQLDAVTHVDGPLLVVAGAGSGKTRVLTSRVVNLVREHGVNPRSILAITFTNKAAGEMKDRLTAMLGSESVGRMWVSTFHSACLRICKAYLKEIGLSDGFSIYDEDDCRKLMANVMSDHDIDQKRIPIKYVLSQISIAKNRLKSPSEVQYSLRDNGIDAVVSRLYASYQEALRNNNAMDFDDLLFNAVRLLSDNDSIQSRYQSRFAYILVDEYQDTNFAQNEFVRLLGAAHRNVCVVGDIDQSIYAFRGAEVDNILHFSDMFEGTRVITLEQNYRSTQSILNAANNLIAHNVRRLPKNLWTDKTRGVGIGVFAASNDTEERDWLASEIGRLIGRGALGSQIAILCRSKMLGREIEEELILNRIPCVFVGNISFFDRAYIKVLVSYLRLIVNPMDEIAFRRVINTPRRGLGDASIKQIRDWERYHSYGNGSAISFYQDVIEDLNLPKKGAEGFSTFARVILSARAQATDGERPMTILRYILESLDYQSSLHADEKVKQQQIEQIEFLLKFADTYETIEGLLDAISLYGKDDTPDSDERRVRIMTVHAAKGLEFPCVFIPGLEEGLFPHWHSEEMEAAIEEERRLAYVAITRAQRRLYLSYAVHRRSFSNHFGGRSRFLSEIPSEMFEHLSY